MDIQTFITTYGYLAIFAGVLIEGELVVMTAGFLAARRLLEIDGVLASALIGSIVIYQVLFLLGRHQGNRMLARRPGWHSRARLVRMILQRRHKSIILSYRAFFGLRFVTPVALGMSRISHRRFLVLDTCSAVAWTALFSGLGYFLGVSSDMIMERVHEYATWTLAAGVLLAGGVTLAAMRRMY